MSAGRLDIHIEQGATFELIFQVFDSNNAAISIAGATVRGKVKADLDSATALLTFTGSLVNDGSDGQGKVVSTAAETAALSLDASDAAERNLTNAVYDIEVEQTDGTVLRVLEGFVTISPEATTA